MILFYEFSPSLRSQPLARRLSQYPIDCGPLTSHQPQHDYPTQPLPSASYCSVTFQPLSLSMAMLRSDGIVEVLPLPVSSTKKTQPLCIAPDGQTANQHKSRLSFSNTNGKNMLAYRNAVYSTSRNNPKNPSHTSLPPLLTLSPESRNICFFYGDKFLASSTSSTINLHLFNLSSSQTKKVASFTPSSSHSVTTVGCVNSTSSNLLFSLNSDRSLNVIDVASNLTYWSVPASSGRRASHSLALPPVSPNCAVPSDMYNLVACASHDEGGLISLWDVRTASPAARFSGGHVNRVLECRVNFSPCMRYISTGSEDAHGAAYYDLRKGDAAGERIKATSSQQ